ncbi:MAG TPA: DEAD/DEAH box helicase, partial [Alphaproteobacteria bacterium]
MRPEILNPLFAPVTALPGVGRRLAAPLGRLAGPRVVDLLWHLPSAVIDRRFSPKVAEAPDGAIATVTVTVIEHRPPYNPRQPYRVMCQDDSGDIALVFFHAKPDYLRRILPPGEVRVVSGTVAHFAGAVQMTHPDHVVTPAEASTLPRIEPVYPLTEGITPRPLAKAIAAALARAPELPEWLDPAFKRERGWPDWRAAVAAAHAPASVADLAPETPARQRLAFDELLANQLALALVRQHLRRTGRALAGDGRLRAQAAAALPFALTASQAAAVAEIAADLALPRRMLRLLQGDVGSGKTVVALMAMLIAVEAGCQAALLAPTEILARQHYDAIAPLAAAAGVRAAALTGRDKGKARERLLADAAAGAIDILIGTHALIQKDVRFRDLALAVVDEQHRFGVHQRIRLQAKGHGLDMLVMTATPIPRTLMLTAYGDMDVSRLTEKPPGRQPVTTAALPLSRLAEVVAAVRRA